MSWLSVYDLKYFHISCSLLIVKKIIIRSNYIYILFIFKLLYLVEYACITIRKKKLISNYFQGMKIKKRREKKKREREKIKKKIEKKQRVCGFKASFYLHWDWFKKKKKFFIYFTYLGNNQGEKKKTTRHNGGQLGGLREERKKSNKDPVNYILVVQMIVSSPFLWNHIESVNRWWINKNKESTEFPFLNNSVFVRFFFFFFLSLFPHMNQFGW